MWRARVRKAYALFRFGGVPAGTIGSDSPLPQGVARDEEKFPFPLAVWPLLCIFADMAVIRLTKEFSFEAAHALEGYDGACREIHGHSYRLFVTVKGKPAASSENPKCGMVMDFGLLKRIVNEEVVSRLDHALVLRGTEAAKPLLAALGERFGNVVTTPYQPTCENLLADFAARIAPRLPEGVSLHALRLYETATSYAEWYAEDN